MEPSPLMLSSLGRLAGRFRLWRIAALILIVYVAATLIVRSIENNSSSVPLLIRSGIGTRQGLAFEDVRFQSADGTRLHGWYVPHPGAPAAVLFCHGNGGNIGFLTGVLRVLHLKVGAAVLAFDYRGYGRSEGQPSEAGILADARAARAWLAAREKIREQDVVLMGQSLGGAVAVDLAARDGAKALVLESTFDSLPDVAACRFPALPVRWLMWTRFDSAALIGKYHGPLLQVHGGADTIVPLACGRRLFSAANEPKQFLLLPHHGHNDGLPMEYYDALSAFLRTNGNRPQLPAARRSPRSRSDVGWLPATALLSVCPSARNSSSSGRYRFAGDAESWCSDRRAALSIGRSSRAAGRWRTAR